MQPPEFVNIFFYFQFVQESMSCVNQSHRYERWTAKLSRESDPKGAEQTVIGLPAKRKCFTKPVAFCRKDPLQKNESKKNIWSAVNLELYIIWIILYVKVKVIFLYSAVSSL